MNTPFLICGLPRSRTAWLSVFLNCAHEASAKCKLPSELIANLALGRIAGNSESTQALFIDKILKAIPDVKIVIVIRDMESAIRSFMKVSGLEYKPCEQLFFAINSKLEFLSGKNVLRVLYTDLGSIGTASQIWHHCRPHEPFDIQRFFDLDAMNIQQRPELIRQAAIKPNESQLQPFLA